MPNRAGAASSLFHRWTYCPVQAPHLRVHIPFETVSSIRASSRRLSRADKKNHSFEVRHFSRALSFLPSTCGRSLVLIFRRHGYNQFYSIALVLDFFHPDFYKL